MKTALLALPLLFAAAAPAIAMDDTATEAPAAKFTIDTPIETLMADPEAREVVLAEIPDLEANPYYPQIKAMSFKMVQPYSQGMLTDEMLANIAAGLAEIK